MQAGLAEGRAVWLERCFRPKRKLLLMPISVLVAGHLNFPPQVLPQSVPGLCWGVRAPHEAPRGFGGISLFLA